MKETKAYDKIRRARISLVLEHPFFASLALRLKLVEDFSCHTAWTDGNFFGYNPHYISMLSSEKLVGLTAHIVMHPACNHHKRRGNRDVSTWNKACDYVINGILLDAGFTLPDGYLYKESLADHSAEAVFTLLSGGDGDEGGDDEAVSEHEQEKHQIEEEDTGQESSSETSAKQNGAENEVESAGQPLGDPGLSGEVRDAEQGGGGGDTRDEEVNWDEAVIQAAITARGTGDLPGGVIRMLNGKLHTPLSWRELLSRFVENSARSDYSWLAPNRRYIHQGLYFPSLKNNELGTLLIAIDTSGSIGKQELAQFSSEIKEIANTFSTTLKILHCDTKVVKIEHIAPHDITHSLQPVGGGGTDFRPVFKHIEDEDLQPKCLIYLTDLECLSYPKNEPQYPVLWVRVGNGKRTPPFGDVVELTLNE